MRPEEARELARSGRLYPSTILHGGGETARREEALRLARTVLCERPAEERPCGECRHCRRVVWPGEAETFHPDFTVLERDLKTVTSVESTRSLVAGAHFAPYEARGQMFVVANAETLSGEAANALLKTLEEPGESWPRHFLLLVPSQFDLLPTLRSRSWSVYLGADAGADEQQVAALAGRLRELFAAWGGLGRGLGQLRVAAALAEAGDFRDPRAMAPWTVAAAALRRASDTVRPEGLRGRLLALAEALLAAPDLRLRGIPAERILDGLVARHLGR